MTRMLSGLIAALAMVVVSGCSGNPLVGSWVNSFNSGPTTITDTLNLNGDGSRSEILTFGGDCTGTQTYTGLTWASGGFSILLEGTGTCSGTMTCSDGHSYTCEPTTKGSLMGNCNYALSDDHNMLTISDCTGGAGSTFTRK